MVNEINYNEIASLLEFTWWFFICFGGVIVLALLIKKMYN